MAVAICYDGHHKKAIIVSGVGIKKKRFMKISQMKFLIKIPQKPQPHTLRKIKLIERR